MKNKFLNKNATTSNEVFVVPDDIDLGIGESRHVYVTNAMITLLKNAPKIGAIASKDIDELASDLDKYLAGTSTGRYSSLNLVESDSHVMMQFNLKDIQTNSFEKGIIKSALGLKEILNQVPSSTLKPGNLTIEKIGNLLKDNEDVQEDLSLFLSALEQLFSIQGMQYDLGKLSPFAFQTASGSNYYGSVCWYRTPERSFARCLLSFTRDSDESKMNKQNSKLKGEVEQLKKEVEEMKKEVLASKNLVQFLDDQVEPEKTITEVLEEAGNYVTLIAALKAAQLFDVLNSKDKNYTLFAPSDGAFNKIPQNDLTQLLKPENKEVLTSVLLCHVIEGKSVFKNLNSSQKALSGDTLNVDQVGDTVQGSPVVQKDINSANGLVNEISEVILQKSTLLKLQRKSKHNNKSMNKK
jgi:uncharacterized surface protein with fasciclin (FAS1) repeats